MKYVRKMQESSFMLWFKIMYRMHEEYLGNLMNLIHIGGCCRVLQGSYDGKKLKKLNIGTQMMS